MLRPSVTEPIIIGRLQCTLQLPLECRNNSDAYFHGAKPVSGAMNEGVQEYDPFMVPCDIYNDYFWLFITEFIAQFLSVFVHWGWRVQSAKND